MEKQRFLETHIFNGLKNINDGFDAEYIFYFSESDFEVVLDRVEQHGIGVFGIEPWLDGTLYDVKGFEDYGTSADNPEWYRKAFAEFKRSGENLMYSASSRVPKNLLRNNHTSN